MKARSIMTVNVMCVLPETKLSRAWQVMQSLKARHLPVVSATGGLVGILSDRDLLAWGTRQENGSLLFGDQLVGEAMTPDPITCGSGATASQMASVMLDRKIDALPITAPDGKLKGLVTSSDLIALLIRLDDAAEPVPFQFELQTETAAAS